MRSPQIPRVPLLVTILAALLALGSAGAAAQAAKRCEAPPGVAGSEQYCETLPTGSGERQSTGRAGAGGSYDRGTRRSLERAGSDGRGVLALPSGGGRAPDPAERQAGSRRERPDPPGAPIGSLGSALESGSSAGEGFVWLLLAVGLAMGGIAWWRWRRA